MKTILARGCFDLLHIGHIRHLEQARAMGDSLIVTLTQDEYVGKGPGRPVFPLDLRREALMALKCVDWCFAGLGPDATADIVLYKPTLFVKGPECREKQSENLLREIKTVRSIGGDIAYTEGEIHSSSELLEKVLSYG